MNLDDISKDKAMLLYSIGLIGVNLESLTDTTRECLYSLFVSVVGDGKQDLARYHAQQAANSLYGLAKGGESVPMCAYESQSLRE